MPNQHSRRDFLLRTGAWGAAAPLAMSLDLRAEKGQGPMSGTRNAERIGWKVACQLYTFRDRSFYEALDPIESLGIRYVEPCFFLPLRKEQKELKLNESLSTESRSEVKHRLADRGIKMLNYYAPLGADTSGFRKVFDFAKEMGVETLVAEPPLEVFDLLEQLCGEYEINLAVHNHPESPKSMYWSPENVLRACKGRNKRIGACADTGHWVRSGLDAVECLKKLEGRLITMHLKDVAESGNRKSRDVPLGTGKADYTRVLQELLAQKFHGVMSVEYEHMSPHLVEDVAKCLEFVEDFAGSDCINDYNTEQ